MTEFALQPARSRLSLGRRAILALAAAASLALLPTPALADGAAADDVDAPSVAVAAAPVVESSAAASAVRTAMAQLGDPYVWGGAGPDAFDCSGLTMFAWQAAGVQLPHYSRLQAKYGRKVSVKRLTPGDLVFFYKPIHHVAMYIGNGQIVQAERRGSPVMVSNLSDMPRVVAARHLA